jgi:GDP-L-fucose synthase
MRATIFGASGLLGQALSEDSRDISVLKMTSKDADLRSQQSCDRELVLGPKSYRDVWINAAAKVGGVKSNTDYVADFYRDNIDIATNVIDYAKKLEVSKLVSILSTCVYPDAPHVKYPLTEDQLHMGPPHFSNFGYAYAKRMLDVASRAYRQQHGCNFITVVPNNLYGPHDNYDINGGHVIPSLIRKFYEAHVGGTDVVVWGTGKPLREFTFSKDAASITWWLAKNYSDAEPVNIGNTEEVSIGDLASTIGKIMGFKGRIKFDTDKPEGQLRKPTSNLKLRTLGCAMTYTSLEEGLTMTIDHFVKSYPNVRGIK